MSLVTSCPNCETSFIVKPEQLATQAGKVRCGHCQHVFNAVDYLTDLSKDNTAPTEESPAEQLESSEQLKTPDLAAAEADIYQPSFSAGSDSAESDRVESDSAQEVASEEGAYEGQPQPQPIDQPQPVHHSDHADTTIDLLLDIDPVTIANPIHELDESIFKPKERPFHWFQALTLIFLALLALAQSVYFMRQNIAIAWPQTKPYLTQLCETLHCKIELPQNPDLLTIDDSDLKEDAEIVGLIHLSSSLINNAPYAQAYPNLELTLTDVNDVPLLRRTFRPKEYLPAATILNNGIASGAETHVNLSLTASGESVTGYRVFLTYDESNENH